MTHSDKLSTDLCSQLEHLWHQHFPLSKAMDVRVDAFLNHQLTTRTRLAPNTNIHNTAFAGSLYAIESLTAWGLLYLELQQAGFDASIIHARGNIEFDSPLRDDIVAVSRFDGQEHIFAELRSSGKARLSLSTQVFAAADTQQTNVVSSFEGLYVVRLNRADQ